MESLIAELGLPSDLKKRQIYWVDHFNAIKGWENRYKEIIQIGKKLPSMPDEIYEDQFLVKGCQSKVWLKAKKENENVLFFADSDAMIVKGLVTLLLSVYSGQAPAAIVDSSPEFLKKMGFHQALSPSRANGLNAMIHQIRLYGHALSLV